ncbi:MAG: hypothetical protein J1F07_05615 [Muribaculaceae bacterium]|nr:hypothetical protein [Muribaculaceae bacterium]
MKFFIKFFKSILRYIFIAKLNGERYFSYLICIRKYKSQIKKNGFQNSVQPGEKEYLKFWKKYSKRVEPYSYRLFSHYIKDPKLQKYILPEYIGFNLVDYYLNPINYRDFYSDKNSYSVFLKDTSFLPQTLLYRIGGTLIMSEMNQPAPWYNTKELADKFHKYDKIILKPSVGSASGIGVDLFVLTENGFKNNKGTFLDSDYLSNFGNDFILQEAIKQHPYIAQFNESSVNTFRIVAYRSVKDEEVYIMTSYIRIGNKGAFIDNAHAGGKFIGIHPDTGILNKYVCDQYGQITNTYNEIDFSTSQFKIPSWDKIIDAVKEISKKVLHHRYIAFDMTLDKDNNPKMIEFNIGNTAFWSAMFAGQLCFGDKTEEIMGYCKNQEIKRKNGEIKHYYAYI